MAELVLPSGIGDLPDPGGDLISRVAGGPDREAFLLSGRRSVRELERVLAVAERPLDSFESVLDFGCGCGRMLLWLEELGRVSALHGTDIDGEAVAWCRANLPFATVAVNDADPPLPYPSAMFDLVFNHSVFTHIDERRQDLWLAELRRVTRPDGLLVLSTHGERAVPDGAWEIRDRLERDGIAFLDGTSPADLPLPDWYQNTWHAPWYVFEHWGQWFEILAYIPGGSLDLQDHVLLKRTAEDAKSVRPISARPRLPAASDAETRVDDALASANSFRVGAGKNVPEGVRGLARRWLLRTLRPYTVHEDRFDSAVATSIAELARMADDHAQRLDALEHRSSDTD
jgi:SAM-dependent methyltransferase